MIASLAFSKDRRLLATGGFNALGTKHPVHVILWDVASGTAIRRMSAPPWVRSVAFSEDRTLLATASDEKAVAVWSPGT